MTEPLTERSLLKRLRDLIARVPADAPNDDWADVMTVNQTVLTLVLDSHEPVNKTRAYQKRAETKLDELESFIERRNAANWSPATLSRK